MLFEKRPIELRAEGRQIIGDVMVYGRAATVLGPGGTIMQETFQPGAFREYLTGYATRLNLMHDRSIEIASTAENRRGKLELFDSAEVLRLVATLPAGEPFDMALELVRDGTASQTSIEFRAIDQRIEGEKRTIERATLPGVALVDSGAYAGAVETRRQQTAPAPRRRYLWL